MGYLEPGALSSAAKQLTHALETYDFDSAEQIIKVFDQEVSLCNRSENEKDISDEAILVKLEAINQQIKDFDSTVVDSVDDLLDLTSQSR